MTVLWENIGEQKFEKIFECNDFNDNFTLTS